MQADVLPLFFFDMYLGFRLNSFLFMDLRAAVRQGSEIRFAAHHIIDGAGRNPLGKFAAMIRNKLPVWVLLPSRMDLYFCAIKRTFIWPVCSSEYQAIMLLQSGLIFRSQ